jgi:hypothetical protein
MPIPDPIRDHSGDEAPKEYVPEPLEEPMFDPESLALEFLDQPYDGPTIEDLYGPKKKE